MWRKSRIRTKVWNHNVPLIVGMSEAYKLAVENRKTVNENLKNLRNFIISEVIRKIPGSIPTGHPDQRLPNHSSFVFDDVLGQDLVVGLDIAGFAVSSGSACKVGNPSPSQVLMAIGIPDKLARGDIKGNSRKRYKRSGNQEFHRSSYKID